MAGDITAFVAVDVGFTIADDGSRLPTVVIDADGRPEVSDLARVHASEGVGDVNTVAMRSGDAVLIGVRLTSPVAAAFAVVFDAASHGPFLDEVSGAGSLTVATTDPGSAEVDRPLWLSVDIDGDALRRVVHG